MRNASAVFYLGSNMDVLKRLPDNSIDSSVSDPPYELGFMGKKWDKSGIAYDVEMWRELYRVLKPGSHVLAFGGTRTYHRMACAIEDAGFEIRDQLQWLYGQGFPKSLNISKAIDSAAGAEREVLATYFEHDIRKAQIISYEKKPRIELEITTQATPEAEEWEGWGTALKPANEPICLARKPISEKSVYENVLKWGTGGIFIDGCRIALDGEIIPINKLESWSGFGQLENPDYVQEFNTLGRFPSNVILTHDERCEVTGLDEHGAATYKCVDNCPVKIIDQQSGFSKSGPARIGKLVPSDFCGDGGWAGEGFAVKSYGGQGGASRFFYIAKASKKEKNLGLDEFEEMPAGAMKGRHDGSLGGKAVKAQNTHPTVKPIALMQYLVRMITPPGGNCIDHFAGSGSTGCACMLEGNDFIGIDLKPEHIQIAERRVTYWREVACGIRENPVVITEWAGNDDAKIYELGKEGLVRRPNPDPQMRLF